jgi:iron complex outermembrane receptor protein
MDYKDELVKTGRLDIFGNPVEENIPKTRHFGLELELTASVFDNKYGKLQLSGNATLSKNEIVDYNFVTYDGSTFSFKGNPISGFPQVMGNFAISYTFKNLFVSLIGQYVGEYRTDNYGDLLATNQKLIEHLRYRGDYYADNKLDPYFVMHFDANYTFKHIGIIEDLLLKIQIRNLLNKLYAAGAEGKEFFPAAERSFFVGIELGF